MDDCVVGIPTDLHDFNKRQPSKPEGEAIEERREMGMKERAEKGVERELNFAIIGEKQADVTERIP